MVCMRVRAFTLAELLLALLILGQIAAFTIPKVLVAQQDAQKKAVFREMYSALTNLGYLQCIQNPGITAPALRDKIKQNLNAIKICAVEANCGTAGLQTGSTPTWYLFANGAVVQVGSGLAVDINIDWNGGAGPNVYGEDRMWTLINPPGVTFAALRHACVLSPPQDGFLENQALLEEIMSK